MVGSAHGTHIAGIVGAVGNNNLGITGVNWQAQIVALRIGGGDSFFGCQSDGLREPASNQGLKQQLLLHRGVFQPDPV